LIDNWVGQSSDIDMAPEFWNERFCRSQWQI